jgi:hypothetical protein
LRPEELSVMVPEVAEIWMPLPPGQPAVVPLLWVIVGTGVGGLSTTWARACVLPARETTATIINLLIMVVVAW